MKRFLSLLLLCTMCILPLFACSETDNGHGKPTVLGGESSDMISSLTEYLESLHQYVTPGETSLAIKIRRIREKGAQPLLVEFNSPECYYVCGYYKGTHSFKREKIRNCCVSDYLWLRYEKEEDIRESYQERTCVVAFRLDPASSVTDIRSESDAVPAFEHFEKVEPVFEEGYNIEKFQGFDQVFVYLNSVRKDKVYYTTSVSHHIYVTFRCIRLDGQIFIPTTLYEIQPTGERYDYDLKWEFGEYYDSLMAIMRVDRYTVETTNGTIYYEGIFLIEDFGKILE